MSEAIQKEETKLLLW